MSTSEFDSMVLLNMEKMLHLISVDPILKINIFNADPQEKSECIATGFHSFVSCRCIKNKIQWALKETN